MKKGERVGSAWINSQQAKEVAEYYSQGHSIIDTANKFCVTTCQVNNLVKKRGITNGGAGYIRRKHDEEKRFAEIIADKGFDYVGGYENQNSKVRIRCRLCGYEFERTGDFLKRGNVICSECEKKKKAAELQEAKKAKAEAKEAKAEAKRITEEILHLWYPPQSAYVNQHESFLNRHGVCKICGASYTVRDYVESCGLKYARDAGVCSKECARKSKRDAEHQSRKRRGVQDNHRHRARKYGCEYDSSISLKRLIDRDGLRCAICGKMCDPNDHSWSKYFGPKYPSIDHIIPMSKGGGHTWDNVQVAHIICNSEKGDSFEGVSA